MITALVQCVLDKVDCLFSFHFSVGQTVQGLMLTLVVEPQFFC